MLGLKTRDFTRRLVSLFLVYTFLLSGCADRYGRILEPTKERTVISKTHSDFSSLANRSNLPTRYVSEGKIGVSKVEAALEEADVIDLQARARLNKQLSDFNARRTEMEAQVNKNLSEANALRQKYSKEYSKAMSQIAAREAEVDAFVSQKETIIASLTKEGESKHNDIITEGREKFDSETARIDQLRGILSAIDIEGNATILEMTETANATRQRASATVLDLEAEARSIKLETDARTSELEEQIKSAKIRTKSEVERLRSLNEALVQESAAQVKELRAKANTIKENLANGEYQLKLTEAEYVKTEAQAKTQEKSANAPTRFEKAIAEIDRLRAGITHHQDSSAAGYDSQFAEIKANLDDELNEIKKLRVSADRAEQVARAEFVKAEASARAEAVRQTAIHAEALAEAQKMQIIAEAEAEAAKLKQEFLKEIAYKKASKKVELSKNTTPAPDQPEELHQVPDVPEVAAVTARIEPDYIADYRKSFAGVMMDRAQADAYEMVAEATFAEAQTNLLAVKTQEDAIAMEQLAIADALEAQARSRFSEIETKTQKEMDVVESVYRQQVVQAESYRKEMDAEVMDHQSQANALDQISNARADQIVAEADALEKSGLNDVKELEVNLWAAQQRGDAQYAKLMKEAESVGDSQEALAVQIDAQVESARKYLDAELAKIDNSIQASEQIAQADYQQALTQAKVVRQRIDAEISRTNAKYTMEHTIAKAQIQRDKELALSQNFRSEAACDRMVANANTTKVCQSADFDAKYAGAQADMNIVLSANSAKRESAQAMLDAVKARFNARIQQVRAERVSEIADRQTLVVMKRTDLASALAKAMAAREESNVKLATLQKRQQELQDASLANWSDKLAMFKDGKTGYSSIDINISSDQLADMAISDLDNNYMNGSVAYEDSDE